VAEIVGAAGKSPILEGKLTKSGSGPTFEANSQNEPQIKCAHIKINTTYQTPPTREVFITTSVGHGPLTTSGVTTSVGQDPLTTSGVTTLVRHEPLTTSGVTTSVGQEPLTTSGVTTSVGQNPLDNFLGGGGTLNMDRGIDMWNVDMRVGIWTAADFRYFALYFATCNGEEKENRRNYFCKV